MGKQYAREEYRYYTWLWTGNPLIQRTQVYVASVRYRVSGFSVPWPLQAGTTGQQRVDRFVRDQEERERTSRV